MTRSGGADEGDAQPAVMAGSMPAWAPPCREYRRERREALRSRWAQRALKRCQRGARKRLSREPESWAEPRVPQIDVANLWGKGTPLAIVFRSLRWRAPGAEDRPMLGERPLTRLMVTSSARPGPA
jgi:hypothetical protein